MMADVCVRRPIEMQLVFFDLSVSVRTDAPEVEDTCRALFPRFLAREGSPRATIEILSEGDEAWRIRDSVLDAVIEDRSWLPGLVAARLLETAGNEVRDHDLFHAAAVVREGRGAVIAGESGFGKSTLTLALLSRGWGFLSDEVAAIDRGQALLAPFPKAIEIRPEAAEVLGAALEGPARRSGKTAHDPESLFPGCLSGPCPLTAVVFLAAGAVEGCRPEAGSLRVVVHRRDDELPGVLAELSGVTAAAWAGEYEGFPALSVSFDAARFEPWRLDEVLGRRGLLVLDSSAEEAAPVDFDREPRLHPMRRTEGVHQMMSRFRGRKALARRIADHPEGFAGLYLAFLDRFRDVRFHRLEVGRLDPTLDLLEEVVR